MTEHMCLHNIYIGDHTSSDQSPNAAVTNVLHKTNTAPVCEDWSVEILLIPISAGPAWEIPRNSHLLQGIAQLSQHSIQKCPTASSSSWHPETHSGRRNENVCLWGMIIGFFVRKMTWAPLHNSCTKAWPHIIQIQTPSFSSKNAVRGLEDFVAESSLNWKWIKWYISAVFVSQCWATIKPNSDL